MILKTLQLKGFRRYNQETFTFHPHLNIILGDNAQGKTTLLEAIYVLGLTKSHRDSKDEDMIQINAETAEIYAQGVLLNKNVSFSVVLSKSGKKVKYNHLDIARLSDYIGNLNVVMFSPEDLDLIKGGPQTRRRFLDLEIGQLHKSYIYHLSHYRRLLKERNEILRVLKDSSKYDQTMLDVVTEQFALHGEKVIKERLDFTERLNEKLSRLMPLLGQKEPLIKIKYDKTVQGDFLASVLKRQEQDMITGVTSIGPHRDDLSFYLGEEPLKHIASQGQIRTFALALKWSVAEIIYENKNIRPLILLDDVFSELDTKRQAMLLKHLNGENQIFITTTYLPKNHQSLLGAHKIIQIDAGKIKGVNSYE